MKKYWIIIILLIGLLIFQYFYLRHNEPPILDATEYIERHELYQAAGINDIWICGTDKYLQHNMREKFLQKESLGFYDPKFKMFISIPYKNYYWEMKNINQKYSHTNDYFYGLPLNTFVFDSEIYNVLFGKVEVADKKRKIRNNNKNCNENNYPNKYLELQKEKLWENLPTRSPPPRRTCVNIIRFLGL